MTKKLIFLILVFGFGFPLIAGQPDVQDEMQNDQETQRKVLLKWTQHQLHLSTNDQIDLEKFHQIGGQLDQPLYYVGLPLLTLCAAAGKENAVRQLLLAGARPDQKGYSYMTPYLAAKLNGHSTIAQIIKDAKKRKSKPAVAASK